MFVSELLPLVAVAVDYRCETAVLFNPTDCTVKEVSFDLIKLVEDARDQTEIWKELSAYAKRLYSVLNIGEVFPIRYWDMQTTDEEKKWGLYYIFDKCCFVIVDNVQFDSSRKSYSMQVENFQNNWMRRNEVRGLVRKTQITDPYSLRSAFITDIIIRDDSVSVHSSKEYVRKLNRENWISRFINIVGADTRQMGASTLTLLRKGTLNPTHFMLQLYNYSDGAPALGFITYQTEYGEHTYLISNKSFERHIKTVMDALGEEHIKRICL